MSAARPSSNLVTSDVEVVQRFEDAWRAAPPHLDDFLQAEEAARRRVLVEVLHTAAPALAPNRRRCGINRFALS
jgi:hypothetical protein